MKDKAIDEALQDLQLLFRMPVSDRNKSTGNGESVEMNHYNQDDASTLVPILYGLTLLAVNNHWTGPYFRISGRRVHPS